MSAVRKVLIAAAIIAIAAVGGFAVARTIPTEGPHPQVDDPVVVRPASGDDQPKQRDSDPRAGSGKASDDDRGKGNRDGDDDRDDDSSGPGSDDDDGMTPVNPTPGTYDDDDGPDDDDDDDD